MGSLVGSTHVPPQMMRSAPQETTSKVDASRTSELLLSEDTTTSCVVVSSAASMRCASAAASGATCLPHAPTTHESVRRKASREESIAEPPGSIRYRSSTASAPATTQDHLGAVSASALRMREPVKGPDTDEAVQVPTKLLPSDMNVSRNLPCDVLASCHEPVSTLPASEASNVAVGVPTVPGAAS
jgi:hypothetical protein